MAADPTVDWLLPAQEKNVSTSMLDGKVGRIYMPRQDFESLALRKMKVRVVVTLQQDAGLYRSASLHCSIYVLSVRIKSD